ncbi:hypothetical protein IWX90DRAFT_152924 [Phyllosticta citrichinensis]|uniref:NAD(P)-binding protein n=1 Tax=Phyllosticta citrichinensis TaxID=1130410 RepID=A0ABR1XZK3_9PEZI
MPIMPPIKVLLDFVYTQLCVKPPKPTQSFAGRTVIVTGANVGLGLETARYAARLGAAKVIITSRRVDAGERAKQDIYKSEKLSDPTLVEVWQLDLCDYENVKAFAARAEQLPRLDALVCNAGIATSNFKLCEGHEQTITTNVISTFLLALLLLPKLRATAHQTGTLTHLAIVSSLAHFFTDFPERDARPGQLFSDLSDEKKARMDDRYNVSKLLEVFAVRQLAADPELMGARSDTSPYPVVVTAANPGFCDSALRREFYEGSKITKYALKAFELVLARSSEEGARNLVLAVAPGKADQTWHGQYISEGKVKPPSKFVQSEAGLKQQKRVWEEMAVILDKIQPGVTKNF